MASTYTVNLGIEKIGTGEQSGTWGTTTNTNFDLIDQAVNGAVTVTLASAGTSGSPNTLAITNGAASDGRNKFIEFNDGGDLGATAYVQLTPNDAEKIVHIRNSLSGSRTLILFQGTYNASNDFEVPNGKDVVLKFDGAGASATVTDVFTDLQATAITTPDLTATTADINGGTIDGATIATSDITVGAGKTLDVSAGTLTLANDQISGDAINGGTIGSITITTADINGGTIDGVTIGGSSAGAITGTTGQFNTSLNVDGTVTGDEFAVDDTDDLRIRFLNASSFKAGLQVATSAGDMIATSAVDDLAIRSQANILFATGGNTERLRIDSSGNLGLGVTPSAWYSLDTALQIKNSFINQNASGSLVLGNNYYTNASNQSVYLVSLAASRYFQSGGTHTWSTAPSGTAGNVLTFTERANIGLSEMKINDPGEDYDFRVESDSNSHMLFVDAGNDRVGVGRSSPDDTLHVSKAFSSAGITLERTNNSLAKYRLAASADVFTITDTRQSEERLRIDSSGNLLVDTTSGAGSISGPYLQVGPSSGGGQINISGGYTPDAPLNIRDVASNFVSFFVSSSKVGSITYTGSATAYNTSSDARLKENIADAEDAGAKVDAIQVRQFDWKADGSHQDYGMVAQELLTVAPEAVTGDPESDDMMGVDYSKLVPMLVKEIQSLRARVHALEGK